MAKVRFITLEKLLEMRENDEPFTLVDTLPEDTFADGHIPGAINIPSDEIVQQAAERIDKDKPVVTYCVGYACPASTVAARKLLDTGYTEVLDFKGGTDVWTEAGLDLET